MARQPPLRCYMRKQGDQYLLHNTISAPVLPQTLHQDGACLVLRQGDLCSLTARNK